LLEAVNYSITQSGDVNTVTAEIIARSQAIIVDCVENFLLLDGLGEVIKKNNNILALIENSYKNKKHIYSMGAHDYISCPVLAEEIVRRLLPFKTTSAQEAVSFEVVLPESLPRQSSHSNHSGCLNETIHFDEKERELVSKVSKYMIQNIGHEHSLDTLARVVGTNRTSLCLAFRNVYGKTIFSWLRELRMREASRLLKDTRLSIQQVCIEVGYKDPANFSTAFKRYSGIPPRKYRHY